MPQVIECPACRGEGVAKGSRVAVDPCQRCFGSGRVEASGTENGAFVGTNPFDEGRRADEPIPYQHGPTSTPVESYMDKSFIDRTSPRLKQQPEEQQAQGLIRHQPKVVKEGTVVLEVVTRHRVMNREGRDYGATVQVIVPSAMSTRYSGSQERDKVVAMMNCPGGQASDIAMFVGDAIEAMVQENGMMVPEKEANPGFMGMGDAYPTELGRTGFEGMAGFPVDDPLSAESLADTMQDYAETQLDPVETTMEAIGIVVNRLPPGDKRDRAIQSMGKIRELLEDAGRKIKEVMQEPSVQEETAGIIKDEAFDTQSTPPPMAVAVEEKKEGQG